MSLSVSLCLSHPFLPLIPFPTPPPSFPGRRLPTSLSGANHCNKFCSSFKMAFVFFDCLSNPHGWCLAWGGLDVRGHSPGVSPALVGPGQLGCRRGLLLPLIRGIGDSRLVQSAAGNCRSDSYNVLQVSAGTATSMGN